MTNERGIIKHDWQSSSFAIAKKMYFSKDILKKVDL